MHECIRDLRQAIQALKKNPGTTSIIILALALGIGVNVSSFIFVESVVLNPFPFPQLDRLMTLWESQYGKGNRIEENTYESKPYRPAHFFTESDLVESFRKFEIIETGLMDDPEDHGAEGSHIHRLRYIVAAKKSAFEFDGDRYKAASKHQREWGQQIIAQLDLAGNERVLDLGSGDGALTKLLASRVPQGSVLGIDASDGMIAAAMKLEGVNLLFERRNINEMDFTEEFDVIFSNATLH